jgi:multicomponent Na+:H+ antiporter subunit D
VDLRLVTLPVIVPLFAAVLLAALRAICNSRAADGIALIAAGSSTVFSGIILSASRHQTIVYWLGNWQPRNGIAIGICFAVDPIGAGLATLCGGLTVAALIFSCKYFDRAGTLFHVLMLVFLAAMSGFCLTGDAFNMFVFFELMSASAFALCAYKTEEREALQGAANFAVTNTIGAFLVLDGIALIYARTGALNLAQIGRTLGASRDALTLIAFALITSGFLIKGAVVPFHLWLSDAHAVAPTPVCVLFSGVMVELGLYAVVRFYWTVFSRALPDSTPALQWLFILFGTATAVVGGVMCFAQHHLKRLLAFSTISHMGILLMGIGMMTPQAMSGVWTYLAGHSLVKAALFMGAGILVHQFRTVDEVALKGRCHSWAAGLIFAGGGLALAGLPPFATFFGTAMLEDAAKRSGYGWAPAVIMLAGILTGGAVLRSGMRIFLGIGRGRPLPSSESHDDSEKRGPVSPVMTIPALALLAIALCIGVPRSFRDGILRYAATLQDSGAYASRVLEGTPTPVQTSTSADIEVATIIRSCSSALIAAALGWFALAGRFRGFRRSLAASPVQAMVNGLRSLHSGVVGDYVVWIVAGVVAVGVALMVQL